MLNRTSQPSDMWVSAVEIRKGTYVLIITWDTNGATDACEIKVDMVLHDEED